MKGGKFQRVEPTGADVPRVSKAAGMNASCYSKEAIKDAHDATNMPSGDATIAMPSENAATSTASPTLQ